MNIQPDLPPRPGPGGGGGGCQPGAEGGAASISISPGVETSEGTFVLPGTLVQLNGSATVRLWHPDCSYTDHNCSSLLWRLTYYWDESGSESGSKDATSLLTGGPRANPNSFVADGAGRYEVTLDCLELALTNATVATANIIAEQPIYLIATATVWVQNASAETMQVPGVGVRVALATPPNSDAALVQIYPITASTIEISQRSADGILDFTAGLLSLHLIGNASGQVNGFQVSGTIDVTLSTRGQITPPGSGPISGAWNDSNGKMLLVGDAPIVGPAGTGHAWFQVSGFLQLPID
jgi:hypothetical protein